MWTLDNCVKGYIPPIIKRNNIRQINVILEWITVEAKWITSDITYVFRFSRSLDFFVRVIINDTLREICRLKIVKLSRAEKKNLQEGKYSGWFFFLLSAGRREGGVGEFMRRRLWPLEIFHRKTQEQIIELECNGGPCRSQQCFHSRTHTQRMHIHPKNFRQATLSAIFSHSSHCYRLLFRFFIERDVLLA